jgi:hypothetical protein
MILFDLRCGDGHVFEAWFKDGATFEAQREAGEIVCPVCGNIRIAKAPMAPRLAKAEGRGEADAPRTGKAPAGPAAKLGDRLREVRRLVEEHCEDVGERFPEEARKMHYGEAEKRGIYGEASDDEVEELADEGIEVQRVPWLRRHHS